MHYTVFAAAMLVGLSSSAFAQGSAPVFKPLAAEPGIAAAPVAAPVPTPTGPALPKARDGEVIDSEGSGAIPSLPLQMVTENDISYLSGGIGSEEEEQLKNEENQFNLRLLVTAEDGEYVSDVTFALKDAKGAVLLTINDAGPYVYLQLKQPAAYTVEVVGPRGLGKKFSLKLPATGAVKTHLRM